MARKKETDYFEAFVGGVNSACAAADMLCTVFDHYEPEALPGHIEAMHKIEHSADIAKHGTMEQLVREFLPPIDREDIMELSGTIESGTEAAKSIMTTDTKKKEVAVQFEIGGKTVTVGGMCKGSGMIHPNMRSFPISADPRPSTPRSLR